MQMLLHDHAINQSREQNGLVPINSLWLSGGGLKQAPEVAVKRNIFAKSALVRGLASVNGLDVLEIPQSANQLFRKNTDVLLELNEPSDVQSVDFDGLIKALKLGDLKQINLYIEYQGQVLQANIRRIDVFKFWRRIKPMNHYFKEPEF
jgi:hypothetical protein